MKRAGRQRGTIAVLVGITIFVMLLAGGLVIDLGHLHIVQNELQNAADACALAGARELNDLRPEAMDRVTAAAVTTGERNSANLQAVAVDVPEANITFSDTIDGSYERAITRATRFIRCETAQVVVPTWLMQLGGTKNVTLYGSAIARRVPGQTMCALPLAICKMHSDTLQLGTWYSGRLSSGNAYTGAYDWVRFPGMSGASDVARMIAGDGLCTTPPREIDSQSGVATSVAQAWNTRFGLYAGQYRDLAESPPDSTGYAYTVRRDATGAPIPGTGTWPAAANAYADFRNRHDNLNSPYDPNSLVKPSGEPVVLPGSPSPLDTTTHHDRGQDRRLVIFPVIACEDWAPNKKNMRVIGYACGLMLSPVDDPNTDVQIEFRDWVDSPGSACGTTGFPGTTGAMVAALVR